MKTRFYNANKTVSDNRDLAMRGPFTKTQFNHLSSLFKQAKNRGVDIDEMFYWFATTINNAKRYAEPKFIDTRGECRNTIIPELNLIIDYIIDEHISKETLIANKDLFMPNIDKKNSGEYYTPVNIAHHIYTTACNLFSINQPGITIYDPACGHGNLLEPWFAGGHGFNISASTIKLEDILILDNRFWHSFNSTSNYDFLQSVNFDGIPESITNNFIAASNNRLLLLNPPYVTGKANIDTPVYRYLKANNIQGFTNNLAKQFIWQVLNMYDKFNFSAETKTVLILPASFLYSLSWKQVRETLLTKFKVAKAELVQSTDFAGTFRNLEQGICILYLHEYTSNKYALPNSIQVDVLDSSNEFNIIITKKYNMLSKTATIQTLLDKPARYKQVPIYDITGKPKHDSKGMPRTTRGDRKAVGYWLNSLHLINPNKFNAFSTHPIVTNDTYPVYEHTFRNIMVAFAFASYGYLGFNSHDLLKEWNIPNNIDTKEYEQLADSAVLLSLANHKFFNFRVNGKNRLYPFVEADLKDKLKFISKEASTLFAILDNKFFRYELDKAYDRCEDPEVKDIYEQAVTLHINVLKRLIIETPHYNHDAALSNYIGRGLTELKALGILLPEELDIMFNLQARARVWFKKNMPEVYRV